jgi:hypothetical protein
MNIILRIEGDPEEMRSALPERLDGSSEVDVQLRLGNRPKYVGRLAHLEIVRQDSDRWILTLSTSGDLQEAVPRGAPATQETGPREDPARRA